MLNFKLTLYFIEKKIISSKSVSSPSHLVEISPGAMVNARKLPSCPSRPTLMLGLVEGGGGRGGGGGGGRGVVVGVAPGRQP